MISIMGGALPTPDSCGPPFGSRVFWTRDGRVALIRLIRPEDAAMERRFVRELSDRSRYQRFFGAMRELTPVMVELFTRLDERWAAALIATADVGGRETEVGVARYVIDGDRRACEFALVVADDWQGQGLGYQLLGDLLDLARRRGVPAVRGLIFATNAGMIRLAKDLGFKIRRCPDDASLVVASKSLDPGVSGKPR